MADSADIREAVRPGLTAAIMAAVEAGENVAGFALALPIHEPDGDLGMYVVGGLMGEDEGQSPEHAFRILAEALAFILNAHLDELGPLLPDVFRRIVEATGGTVETMHFEAPDVVPEDDDPVAPLPGWMRRRRG